MMMSLWCWGAVERIESSRAEAVAEGLPFLCELGSVEGKRSRPLLIRLSTAPLVQTVQWWSRQTACRLACGSGPDCVRGNAVMLEKVEPAQARPAGEFYSQRTVQRTRPWSAASNKRSHACTMHAATFSQIRSRIVNDNASADEVGWFALCT
jgi:hypothetical protein